MNLATIIERHPDDAVAVISRGRPTTYGELRRQVGALRAGLIALGVRPGDRVAVLAANNWFFVVFYLAALGAGAVVVPLNPASASRELERELAAIGALVAVVGPSGRDGFAGIDRADIPLEHVLVPEGVKLPGSEPLQQLFGHEPVQVVERADDDDALLMFTAGTAGPAKAARLSHGSLRANIEQMQAHPGLTATATDVALGVLPLFHIYGLNVVLNQALFAGAAVVLAERFDPAGALGLIREHGVTMIAGAPPMFAAWAALSGAAPTAFEGVRLAGSGGAPLSPEVASAFQSRFGLPVWQGYGLTEASPTVTSSSVGGVPKAGSIGVPLPGVDVRLVDVDGEDALAGDPGEIWVRGPNVFSGYWEDADATAAVITPDGWLRTGDIAVVDDDGYLFIVDRAKDLIIVSGFNVYPAEVEEVLLEHEHVAEAAVVGVEHPYSGETVTACVVPVAGAHVEEDELIEFAAARLARYKCPTTITFVDQLPQGLVGKVLRRALRP
ncbi:MAG: acyl-CoA synthetase (AMP-forming)/AMP-acid ligase [Acidimicrobiales bacterium]|jgi:long-chain acyl-CoA synthetase|nr:acyl-CoA synthetase (AMP-forming)/AMP-acid ligase [Acidimicrobiales bacterium]